MPTQLPPSSAARPRCVVPAADCGCSRKPGCVRILSKSARARTAAIVISPPGSSRPSATVDGRVPLVHDARARNREPRHVGVGTYAHERDPGALRARSAVPSRVLAHDLLHADLARRLGPPRRPWQRSLTRPQPPALAARAPAACRRALSGMQARGPGSAMHPTSGNAMAAAIRRRHGSIEPGPLRLRTGSSSAWAQRQTARLTVKPATVRRVRVAAAERNPE